MRLRIHVCISKITMVTFLQTLHLSIQGSEVKPQGAWEGAENMTTYIVPSLHSVKRDVCKLHSPLTVFVWVGNCARGVFSWSRCRSWLHSLNSTVWDVIVIHCALEMRLYHQNQVSQGNAVSQLGVPSAPVHNYTSHVALGPWNHSILRGRTKTRWHTSNNTTSLSGLLVIYR